jgi:Ca2+-binding RTX toxin-like protein
VRISRLVIVALAAGALALVAAHVAASGTPISLSPSSLPDWTNGVAYNQTVTASGGTPAYTYTVASGALPNGLGINSGTGAITGTPTVSGTFAFTIQAEDSLSATGTQAYSVTINDAPTVTTSALPEGSVGSSYSQTLAANDGTGAYSWSVSSGALPTGLSLSSGTGAITGSPTGTGTASFTVQVTDSVGATDTQALSIKIFSITPTSLGGATSGRSYSKTLSVTGGNSPFSNWRISSGSLPSGLGISGSTGVISGTTSSTGTFNFTVSVDDTDGDTGTRSYSLSVNSAPSVSTTTLAGGTVGVTYSKALSASGGTSPLTWSKSSGTLPTGLSLSSSGTISGKPTVAGTYSFTVQVQDTNGATASRSLSIKISTAPVISTATLPGATLGKAYAQAISSTGGTLPNTWSIASGSLPPGLALSATTGVISGTPTAAGTYAFSAKLTDSVGASATKPLSIVVAAAVTPPPPPPPAPTGRGCTITGTAGNDVLRGNANRNVICGLGGNDVIYGLGGNDVLYGDGGNDTIYGGNRGDRLVGGAGDDRLYGQRGDDLLYGGAGHDRLEGGAGFDGFFARDRRRDVLVGGPGRDRARVDRRLDRRTGIERLF